MEEKKSVRTEVVLITVVIILFLALIIVISLTSRRDIKPKEILPDVAENDISQTEVSKEPEPEPEPDKIITIRAFGDALYHDTTTSTGLKSDGTYNFDHIFANVKDLTESADIAVINQETVLGGKELGISSYPMFNSPHEVGEALVNSGFDVVMHANNHAMDKGAKGIENTLAFWDKYPEVITVGMNKDEEDRERIRIKDMDGFKIAFLSYTESLNGISLPSGKPWAVNVLSDTAVLKDIEKAKELSDFIVVLPHWGEEYTYTPVASQNHYTKLMADAGVDLIIGTHPHVIEPYEWIEGKEGHKTLVYYSLGNFVSGQNRVPRLLGGMAEVQIVVKPDGKANIETAKLVPLVTHYNNANKICTVYKLSDYNDELAKTHSINSIDTAPFSKEILNKLFLDIVGENAGEKPANDDEFKKQADNSEDILQSAA